MKTYRISESARLRWLEWFKANDIPVEDIAYGLARVADGVVTLPQFVRSNDGHRIVHICDAHDLHDKGGPAFTCGHYAKRDVAFPVTHPLGEWADECVLPDDEGDV